MAPQHPCCWLCVLMVSLRSLAPLCNMSVAFRQAASDLDLGWLQDGKRSELLVSQGVYLPCSPMSVPCACMSSRANLSCSWVAHLAQASLVKTPFDLSPRLLRHDGESSAPVWQHRATLGCLAHLHVQMWCKLRSCAVKQVMNMIIAGPAGILPGSEASHQPAGNGRVANGSNHLFSPDTTSSEGLSAAPSIAASSQTENDVHIVANGGETARSSAEAAPKGNGAQTLLPRQSRRRRGRAT